MVGGEIILEFHQRILRGIADLRGPDRDQGVVDQEKRIQDHAEIQHRPIGILELQKRTRKGPEGQ